MYPWQSLYCMCSIYEYFHSSQFEKLSCLIPPHLHHSNFKLLLMSRWSGAIGHSSSYLMWQVELKEAPRVTAYITPNLLKSKTHLLLIIYHIYNYISYIICVIYNILYHVLYNMLLCNIYVLYTIYNRYVIIYIYQVLVTSFCGEENFSLKM